MKKKLLRFGVDFFDLVERKAILRTDGISYIYLPKSWAGKKLVVLCIE